MKTIFKSLDAMGIYTHIKSVGCCCGHNKYPMTIVIQNTQNYRTWEFFTGVDIPRKKRFYKKDKEGYYYIPEVVDKLKW